MPKENEAQSRAISSCGICCRCCGDTRMHRAGIFGGYRYFRCNECGFVFCPDITERSATERNYDLVALWRDDLPEQGWADAGFLDAAFRLLPGGPLTILDFGAGQSTLPEMFRMRGHRVIAIDIAPPLTPHPDRLTGDILGLSLPGGGFDLIYSFQVFEHLHEPRPILFRLLDLTRKGGIVVIHTDMHTEQRKAGFERWWYVLLPDHCSFHGHRTFQRMLEGMPHHIVRADAKTVCIRKS